ncbi:MAG: phosphatidate cytidylyltransferase [Candidatus Omnitrophica bacterium]|nr:phosphatidate cytidylyltransferase [Candidatus Omnitrophota bacterium]MBU1871948.1 phosphatidate cytidylyltransferase [Candidatus Omnitrophota bacterium]
MITKRVLTALALILVVAFSIAVSWLTNLMIIFFSMLALYEFFSMIEKKDIVIFKYFGMGVGLMVLFSICFRFEFTRGWELLFIIAALLALILIQFRRRENSGVIISLSTTIFGVLYIAWFMSFLVKIRYLSTGAGMLATVVLITKTGDIGAYLLGSRFGRSPLISRVSPNKTKEGFIGGILFSIFAALASKIFMPPEFSYLHLLILGFFLGFLGQLGDLSESLMKRDCIVKDSGNIFSSMGGALDCIDSLLFTAPAFYFWILHFGKFL